MSQFWPGIKDISLVCLLKGRRLMWFIAHFRTMVFQSDRMYFPTIWKIERKGVKKIKERAVSGTSLVNTDLFAFAGVSLDQPWIQTSRGLKKVCCRLRCKLVFLNLSLWSLQPAKKLLSFRYWSLLVRTSQPHLFAPSTFYQLSPAWVTRVLLQNSQSSVLTK